MAAIDDPGGPSVAKINGPGPHRVAITAPPRPIVGGTS